MPELMAWADVAVSAAGSTVWELMFMRIASLFLIVVDNQLFGAKLLKKFSTTMEISVPWNQTLFIECLTGLLTDTKLREEMHKFGRIKVDGSGSSRVIATIRSYSRVSLTNS